ncbi:MAG: hypothetical protein HC771_23815 [Synechococcales cyanobacterium CRU_2_2]|nr:hypothetical protein [Synechococcales cyanobacterium CRU_2_2]
MNNEITQLSQEIHQLAQEKGWWDEPRKGGGDIAAMHGYLSHILEMRRAGVLVKVSQEDMRNLLSIATSWSSVDGDKAHIATLLALIHSEVSEAFQEAKDGIDAPSEKIPEFSRFELELADIVIRAFDLAAAMEIDIGLAIAAKHEFNKTRSHKHGGKKF